MNGTTTHKSGATLPALLLFLLAGIWTSLDAQTRVVTFTTEDAVMLRWIDPDDANSDGYHVYRSASGGPWQKLTPAPLTKATSEDEIEKVAGFKTDLYLSLFGATEPRDLTDSDYRNSLRGEDAGFLRFMLLTNSEFGELMGQRFTDSSVEQGLSINYRIVTLVDGTEKELVATEPIKTGEPQRIPSVDEIDGLAGNTSATVTWKRDQRTLDTGSVVGYNVYRADNPLGPFEQMNTLELSPISISTDRENNAQKDLGQYVDKWLQNGRTYYYHVRSVNIFGIESLPSATIAIAPIDQLAPFPPSSLSLVQIGNHLELSWSTDQQSPSGVEIYRSVGTKNGEFTRVFAIPALPDFEPDSTMSWVDSEVQLGTEYYYYAVATGETGLAGPPSDTLSYLIEDHSPPAPPTNVVAASATDGITITWDPNVESDLLGYEIERAGDDAYRTRALITGSPISVTEWRDGVAKTSATTYGYVVYAIDKNFNRSSPSRMVFARMPDIVPPQSPIIRSLVVEEDVIKLNWTGSPQGDVARYSVYRSLGEDGFARVGQSNSNSYEETPSSDGKYRYAVSALDSSGNESNRSEAVLVTYAKDRNVAPPSFVSANEAENHILVRWGQVSGAAGYVVYRLDPLTRHSLLLAEPDAVESEFKDWRSDRTQEYIYVVQSRDGNWRMSTETEGRYAPDKK